MTKYDIVIIGGGPSGLSAAIAAKNCGVDDILIIDREDKLGGKLNQCIHNGFGLYIFKEDLTGPEYAELFIDMIKKMNIKLKLNTSVINMNKDRKLTLVNGEEGIIEIKAKAIILAMGCCEKATSSINISGSRCAGIYTAGNVQEFINIKGYMPGKEVIILGSCDIGIIMARRMTLEGAKVKGILEDSPYPRGLKRNVVQCIQDFDIPLKLNHTVVKIHGKDRLEGVTIAKIGDNKTPIKDTEEFIKCDTLLLSLGLIPENELSKKAGIKLTKSTLGPIVNENLQTNVEGVFACGNSLHINDLVDNISFEGYKAGRAAAEFVNGKVFTHKGINIKYGEGIRYTVPMILNMNNANEITKIKLRVDNVYKDASLCLYFDNVLEVKAKKSMFIPGEVYMLDITYEMISKYPDCKQITIKLIT